MQVLTSQDYHSHPAVSRSFLWKIYKKSLLHAKLSQPENNASLSIGSAVHMKLLEPHKYSETYITKHDLNRRLKEHRELVQKLEGEGKVVVDFDDTMLISNISSAVKDNALSYDLLNLNDGLVELSFFWKDLETGIECKCRPDMLRDDGIVVDLKTSSDVGFGFKKSVFEYGYHVQAAFYIDGLRANEITVNDFVIVAVENQQPHDVVVYKFDDEVIDYGRRIYKDALKKFKESKESGIFSGFSSEIQTISLPKWLKESNNE